MRFNIKGMKKQAKKAAKQLNKQVRPAVQNALKDPKNIQGLVKGAQGLVGGKMKFGNLRDRLIGGANSLTNRITNKGPMSITPQKDLASMPQLGMDKIKELGNNSGIPASPSLKPELSNQAPIQPPMAAPQQPKEIGPAQQEQAMKNQLMPPAGQPPQGTPPAGQPPQMGQQPQGMEAPAQDSSAIDQQIAALQKQIADLQAQKK